MSNQKYFVRVDAFMRKDDFKKFAEELREQDQNIIVLPPYVNLLYPKMSWIPTSVQLPPNSNEVLVTGRHESDYKHLWVGVDSYFREGGWLNFDEVTAWMPLPEPYRGKE